MVEVVTQIKAAEEQAEEIKKSARSQARKLQDEVVAEGRQMVEAETQKATAEAAQLLSQARERAQSYLAEQAALSTTECDQLDALAKNNLQKAAALIVERIVESL